jgi:hypothetical protein
MTNKADVRRRQAEPVRRVGALRGRFIRYDALLVRIVAGRAGNSFSRHQWDRNSQLLRLIFYEFDHRQRRFYQEMGLKEHGIRHARVTTPAQECNIRP